jgi:hypothetical protein
VWPVSLGRSDGVERGACHQRTGLEWVTVRGALNSYFIWELFKVSGGVIRHIEAIMAMFPYGMRPGW